MSRMRKGRLVLAKVLYIYHEYGGRRKRYGKEISRLGHDVQYEHVKNKKKGKVRKSVFEKSKPDLVWLLSPFYVVHNVIGQDSIEYLKSKGIPICCYSTFGTQSPYDQWLPVWKTFDYLFVHHLGFARYLQTQGLSSAHYMPVGFYPDLYYPKSIQKSISVSFMGNPQTTVSPGQDKRCQYLEAIKDFGVKVYGKSFQKRLKGIRARSFSTHEEQRSVYWKSKICLDLPFVNSAVPFYEDVYHLKNRFFESPACGSFLLTMRNEETTNIYDESMVGFYDNNPESLREAVKFYLKNEKLRESMAQKAAKYVWERHTFAHRFKEMFKIIGC